MKASRENIDACLAGEALLRRIRQQMESELEAQPAQASDARENQPAPRVEQSAPTFMGRALFAKFPGKCAVCGGKIGQGDAVIYRGADKQTAHARCGQDDGGRR